MLQPVATSVSTSRACLLVTASCFTAIYTSSLIVEPPLCPPLLHSFATACQRTSESKTSQALTGTPPCGHTSSLPFALWLCVLSQQPFLCFYSLGLPPADASLHAAPWPVSPARCCGVSPRCNARQVHAAFIMRCSTPWPAPPASRPCWGLRDIPRHSLCLSYRRGYSLHSSSKGGSYEQDY